MSGFFGFFRRVNKAFNPPTVEKSENPIRFGILGAAAIGPDALIKPAKSHPGVVVHAVAARDLKRAEEYAKEHGIPKVHGSYQALLDDPEIDVIYNPLPNGYHYEWTMKALKAGKHVLLEKPSANTAEDSRKMFEYAESKNLILLEAVHYRFHPAIQRVKAIVESKEVGPVKSLSAHLELPSGIVSQNNIRYDFPLGGGALMDCGSYAISCIRYLTGSEPTQVISSVADTNIPPGNTKVNSKGIDRKTTALLAFPNDVTGDIDCDLATPNWLGFIPAFPQWWARVETENGWVGINNFAMPTVWHTISVFDKRSGKTRTEKVYTFQNGEGKGEEWWSTYRFQLEAFVDKLQGRTPQTWVTKEDSVANLTWIENIYAKNGLGSRPASNFTI